MLLDAAVLTIVVGLIAGGRFGRLKDVGLRAAWVFVLAALVRVSLTVLGARGWGVIEQIGGLLHIATYLLLVVGLWLNRHLCGLRVAAVGVLLNLVVIAANGGSMPVRRELAVRTGNRVLVQMLDSPTYVTHVPMTAETRLWILGDVLLLPRPYPNPHVFSVGDVLVTLGACCVLLHGMGAFGLGRKREERAAESGEGGP